MGKSILCCYNLLDSRLSQQRSDTPLIWDSEDGKQQVCARLNRKWLILILKGWCKTATVQSVESLEISTTASTCAQSKHCSTTCTQCKNFTGNLRKGGSCFHSLFCLYPCTNIHLTLLKLSLFLSNEEKLNKADKIVFKKCWNCLPRDSCRNWNTIRKTENNGMQLIEIFAVFKGKISTQKRNG